MRILLVCAGGASTSILVESMKEALPKEYENWEIDATSYSESQEVIGKYDYVLMAPQIRFQKKLLQKKCDLYGSTLLEMPVTDYGRNNGEGILKMVLNEIETRGKNE